jgi:hypothetical protein
MYGQVGYNQRSSVPFVDLGLADRLLRNMLVSNIQPQALRLKIVPESGRATDLGIWVWLEREEGKVTQCFGSGIARSIEIQLTLVRKPQQNQ